MDILTGLELLRENTWGTTKKVLTQAINEIVGNRDTILKAGEYFQLLEAERAGRAPFDHHAKMGELEGQITAAAGAIAEIQDRAGGGE